METTQNSPHRTTRRVSRTELSRRPHPPAERASLSPPPYLLTAALPLTPVPAAGTPVHPHDPPALTCPTGSTGLSPLPGPPCGGRGSEARRSGAAGRGRHCQAQQDERPGLFWDTATSLASRALAWPGPCAPQPRAPSGQTRWCGLLLEGRAAALLPLAGRWAPACPVHHGACPLPGPCPVPPASPPLPPGPRAGKFPEGLASRPAWSGSRAWVQPHTAVSANLPQGPGAHSAPAPCSQGAWAASLGGGREGASRG